MCREIRCRPVVQVSQECSRATLKVDLVCDHLRRSELRPMQMQQSGRTWPPARDFADRPAIRRSLLKAPCPRQTLMDLFAPGTGYIGQFPNKTSLIA
jgi:hypothetical protein